MLSHVQQLLLFAKLHCIYIYNATAIRIIRLHVFILLGWRSKRSDFNLKLSIVSLTSETIGLSCTRRRPNVCGFDVIAQVSLIDRRINQIQCRCLVSIVFKHSINTFRWKNQKSAKGQRIEILVTQRDHCECGKIRWCHLLVETLNLQKDLNTVQVFAAVSGLNRCKSSTSRNQLASFIRFCGWDCT